MMNEYRPFLEVVAEMKEGDIADHENKQYDPIAFTDERYWYWSESIGVKSYVQLDKNMFGRKYKIRPRYVGWDEAQKALGEGKYIKLHCKGLGVSFHKSTTVNFMNQPTLEKVTFEDLLNGKFTILEDK